jgi:hypothetical protein
MPEPGAAALTCRLRVVVRGISPLIWRRLLVPADITIVGLHEVLQVAAFGWSGAYLHRFKVHGREYGLCYDGGPVFRDDARQVRLVSLGLREGERFTYEYNFLAAWHLDLRLEQVTGPGPGRAHPRPPWPRQRPARAAGQRTGIRTPATSWCGPCSAPCACPIPAGGAARARRDRRAPSARWPPRCPTGRPRSCSTWRPSSPPWPPTGSRPAAAPCPAARAALRGITQAPGALG